VYPENNDKIGLAVIDYGMGNLRSVVRALEKAGGAPRIVSTPAEAARADAVVFPGQGAIVDAMRRLKDTGFDAFLRDWIAADRPFFGICLGMQVLFDFSEEGDTPGLGIFPGCVKRFRLQAPYKIPHMGWNQVSFTGPDPDPLLSGIARAGESFYFVHSYHVDTPDPSLVWGTTEYGYPFVSAIRRGRCTATQFHPEKSQAKGLRLYQNFLQSLGNVS